MAPLAFLLLAFLASPSQAALGIDPCVPTTGTMDERNLSVVNSIGSIPEGILRMADKLEALSPACANIIWPGSGVGSYQSLLVDPATNEPWLWRPKGFNGPKDPGGLEKVDASELKDRPEIFKSKYSFTEFRGKRTTTMRMGDKGFQTYDQALGDVEKQKKMGRLPPDFELTKAAYQESKEQSINTDFNTLVHEGFHAYGQGVSLEDPKQCWHVVNQANEEEKKGIFNRYSNFPPESEPRYFRRMQFDALAKAAASEKGPGKEKLIAEAAYWQEKYKSSSDESGRTKGSDVMEGTAKYFDFMANLYAKHGCAMGKEKLQGLIKRELALFLEKMNKQGGLPPVADLESYNIGLMANLLLAEKNSPADWQKRIAGGQTPVELLAKGVAPRAAPGNEQALAQIQQMQAKDQEAMQGTMDGLTKHFEDSEYVRVQLPESAGSVGHLGFYKTKGIDNAVIAASATKNYQDSRNNKINLENVSMLNVASGAGCEKNANNSSNYILVPKSSLKTAGAVTEFEFTDPETAIKGKNPKGYLPKVKGQGEFAVNKDASGKEWYCLK